MHVLLNRWLLGTAALATVAVAVAMGSQALAGSNAAPASAKGLGPLTGLLPRDHLTVESAIQVDLGKEAVRLPLYRGGQMARPSGTSYSTPPIRGSRTISASTTRRSWATSRSAARTVSRQ